MKKIIKLFAGILFLLILADRADAFCGLGGIFGTPSAPTCTCGSNKVAIKHMSGNICQEERCISQGLAQHYLNNGWIYGCCSSARMGDQVQDDQTSLSSFPNPASSQVTTTFSLNSSQNVTIQIFDLNGRIVSTIIDQFYEKGKNKIEWNASKLSEGIYFLQLHSNELQRIEKIFIAKE